MTTTTEIELPIDFNTMDDTGLPWTFLDEAVDPSRIVPGAHVVAGRCRQFFCVVLAG